jgi:hypothetical protein
VPAVSNILAKNVTGCVNLAAKFIAYQSTAAPAQITSGVQALNRHGLFLGDAATPENLNGRRCCGLYCVAEERSCSYFERSSPSSGFGENSNTLK